jgi:spore germination protein GerM
VTRTSNVEAIASIIGAGVHTCLRKTVDSPEAHAAWLALNALPTAEWYLVCQTVARVVVKRTRPVEQALERLLQAPDLNLDDLEPETRAAMEQAWEALNGCR